MIDGRGRTPKLSAPAVGASAPPVTQVRSVTRRLDPVAVSFWLSLLELATSAQLLANTSLLSWTAQRSPLPVELSATLRPLTRNTSVASGSAPAMTLGVLSAIAHELKYAGVVPDQTPNAQPPTRTGADGFAFALASCTTESEPIGTSNNPSLDATSTVREVGPTCCSTGEVPGTRATFPSVEKTEPSGFRNTTRSPTAVIAVVSDTGKGRACETGAFNGAGGGSAFGSRGTGVVVVAAAASTFGSSCTGFSCLSSSRSYQDEPSITTTFPRASPPAVRRPGEAAVTITRLPGARIASAFFGNSAPTMLFSAGPVHSLPDDGSNAICTPPANW